MNGEPKKEKGLGGMIFLSALLHTVLLGAIVAVAPAWKWRSSLPTAYTVELVDPDALGGKLPIGSVGHTPLTQEKAARPKVSQPPEEKDSQQKVAVAKKEELKPAPVVKEEPKPPPVVKEVIEAARPKVSQPPEEKDSQQKVAVAKKEEPKLPPVVKKETVKGVPQPSPSTPPTQAEPRQQKLAPAMGERDMQIARAVERIRQQTEKKGGTEGPSQGRWGVGGEGPGGGGVVKGLDFLIYYNQVQKQVKENWVVAEKTTGLHAVVKFGIQPEGEIFDVNLVESSGDSAFDQSVLRAVKKASPLPPPPRAYQEDFFTQKVEVTFRSEEVPL